MTKTARLYGGSLYDLAVEADLTHELLEQTDQIRRLFRENPDYLRLLGEPSIPFSQRCALIDEAFGSSAERYLVNFIKLLCERGLLREYALCCDEYKRRYHEDHHILCASAVSAVPLTDQQREALRLKLEKLCGSSVELSVRVDPAVMGGLRVEMEGKQLDGTIQGRLGALSRKLSEITV